MARLKGKDVAGISVEALQEERANVVQRESTVMQLVAYEDGRTQDSKHEIAKCVGKSDADMSVRMNAMSPEELVDSLAWVKAELSSDAMNTELRRDRHSGQTQQWLQHREWRLQKLEEQFLERLTTNPRTVS